MLKEKQRLILNNEMELGESISDEAKGKGKKFVSRFIESGVAHYEEFGDVLITKETLNNFIETMVGCPVIIQHKDIDDKNADKERVGVVSKVWFNEYDGWYYCEGIIWDKQAIDLVKNQGWSVSCTYDFETDGLEKTHNGKKIDMEFTGGEFLHLALVPNPRYERANIVMNSKDKDDEEGKWITIKGTHVFIPDGEDEKKVVEEFIDKHQNKSSEKKDGEKNKTDTDFMEDKEISREQLKSALKNIVKKYDAKSEKDLMNIFGNENNLKLAIIKEIEKSTKTSDKKGKDGEKKENSVNNKFFTKDRLREDDDIEWITVKGNHIPVRKGQSKEEAVEDFINGLEQGGYSEDGKQSNRSKLAEIRGLGTRSELAKELGLKQKDLEGILFSTEWHHKGKQFKKENYYIIQAYKDLQKDGKISDETIEKYDLSSEDVDAYKSSWELIKKRTNAQKPEDILQPYIEQYKDDEGLQNIFKEALKRKPNGLGGESIKRMLDWVRSGESTIQDLEKEIKYFSSEEREKRKNKNNSIAENSKGVTTMTVLKDLENFVKGIVNNADDKDEVKNEDKRKLIDEVGGILKGKVDDEIIKTIMKKMEEASYEPSEDNKADNKAKNEDEKEEKFEEEKEIAENKKTKNEEEEKKEEKEEEVKNKCMNSMDDVKKIIMGGNAKVKTNYLSKAERFALGEQY